MKKIILFFILIISIFYMLLNTKCVIAGVQNGLMLWYSRLIPALFPYILISNIIIYCNLLPKSIKPTYMCIFFGILFGYPACASCAYSLANKKNISDECANYLICCFNNLSPAFISGYLCVNLLGRSNISALVLVLFYISILLSTYVVKIIFFRKISINNNQFSMLVNAPSSLNNAIDSALISICKIGVYIIAFSIPIELTKNNDIKYLFIPLEVTNGISNCFMLFHTKIALLLSISLIASGGVCGIFQTISLDQYQILDIKKYIYSKIICMLITFIIFYLAIYVLKII